MNIHYYIDWSTIIPSLNSVHGIPAKILVKYAIKRARGREYSRRLRGRNIIGHFVMTDIL